MAPDKLDTNDVPNAIDLEDLSVTTLTKREGPDRGARISPDGTLIAYTGYGDELQGYLISRPVPAADFARFLERKKRK